MKKGILVFLLPIVLVSAMFLVSAGNFQLQYGGADVFTVDTSGNVNASGYMTENGTLLSELYMALSGWNTNIAYYNNSNTWAEGQTFSSLVNFSSNINITGNITSVDYVNANYFVGDGTGLTALPDDMAVIKYANISDLPTCGSGEFMTYDGSTLSCDNSSFTNTNIAYYNNSNTWAEGQTFSSLVNFSSNINITGNITSVDYVNANYFVGDGSGLTNLPDDSLELKYQNISNLPTCASGEALNYDGSTLACVNATFDNTNLAYYNNTNTWAAVQVFNENLNLSTASVVFQDDTSSITRAGAETTNITIDSSGNVIISLG